jgi:chemotaxis protein methyltransferase CheR
MREWRSHALRNPRDLQPPSVSATSLRLLRDLIVERTGVLYHDDKLDLLEERLEEVLAGRGLPSLLDYYYLLRYGPGEEPLWRELHDALAVPETYFWRQGEQLEVLCQELLPRHLAERPGQPLRIWSAACCSGEEPLSIAMALEEGGWFGRLPIQLLGSDASEQLVARARAGVYGERALRSLSPERRARWFRPEGSRWRIDPGLLARVEFSVVNLLDAAAAAPLAASDVIFCRNVFIYFSDAAIQRVAALFAARLRPGGWLFLGASESLVRLSRDFVMDEIGPAFAYRKNPDPAPAGDAPLLRSLRSSLRS